MEFRNVFLRYRYVYMYSTYSLQVKVLELSLLYRENHPPALDNVSFSIPPGSKVRCLLKGWQYDGTSNKMDILGAIVLSIVKR